MERSISLASSLKQKPKLASTRSLTRLEPIEVSPPEIVFKDITDHYQKKKRVTVKNLTAGLIRVRLKHSDPPESPETPKFKTYFENQEPLAPGMATTFIVELQCEEAGNYHDHVVVMT
jgi:hypothetical protein